MWVRSFRGRRAGLPCAPLQRDRWSLRKSSREMPASRCPRGLSRRRRSAPSSSISINPRVSGISSRVRPRTNRSSSRSASRPRRASRSPSALCRTRRSVRASSRTRAPPHPAAPRTSSLPSHTTWLPNVAFPCQRKRSRTQCASPPSSTSSSCAPRMQRWVAPTPCPCTPAQSRAARASRRSASCRTHASSQPRRALLCLSWPRRMRQVARTSSTSSCPSPRTGSFSTP
mmetsp:Transcript_13528/g.36144  ORF Transcript_13528/g.36144 Transcript_13528/m.36144 type:complete len:229 (-) Transcript_13528:800-1486(-)